MNIEEKCNNIIVASDIPYSSGMEFGDTYSIVGETFPRYSLTIDEWKWDGEPAEGHTILSALHKLLDEADASECLTSNCEYIREYKKRSINDN